MPRGWRSRDPDNPAPQKISASRDRTVRQVRFVLRVFRLGVGDAYEVPRTVRPTGKAVVVDVPLLTFTYAGVVYAAELARFYHSNLRSNSRRIISFEQSAYR